MYWLFDVWLALWYLLIFVITLCIVFVVLGLSLLWILFVFWAGVWCGDTFVCVDVLCIYVCCLWYGDCCTWILMIWCWWLPLCSVCIKCVIGLLYSFIRFLFVCGCFGCSLGVCLPSLVSFVLFWFALLFYVLWFSWMLLIFAVCDLKLLCRLGS